MFESGSCFSCSSGGGGGGGGSGVSGVSGGSGGQGECGQLGYYSDRAPGRGSLYLLTREEEPFCGNQYKVNVMFTSTRAQIHTYGRLQLLLVDKDGLNETHPITKLVMGHPRHMSCIKTFTRLPWFSLLIHY